MPRQPQIHGHDTRYTKMQKNYCFVCGMNNPDGMRLKFILDDAMGKVNKLHHVVALTREMTIEYLKPVPLHKPLRVEGRELSVQGRQHINTAEILNDKNEVLARSRGIFIAIDPEKMFAKYVDR